MVLNQRARNGGGGGGLGKLIKKIILLVSYTSWCLFFSPTTQILCMAKGWLRAVHKSNSFQARVHLCSGFKSKILQTQGPFSSLRSRPAQNFVYTYCSVRQEYWHTNTETKSGSNPPQKSAAFTSTTRVPLS